MKTKIDNYSFNKTAKTVTFTDYTTIRLDAILLITNATDGIIIFNFADATKGGTVLNNVLTLAYDTSSMDNTDKLLIYYDDSDIEAATNSKVDEVVDEISNKDIMITLKALITAIANPAYVDMGANQMRVQATGTSTVTFASNQDIRNVTALATLTTLNNLGVFTADHLQYMNNLSAWSLTVRSKIT